MSDLPVSSPFKPDNTMRQLIRESPELLMVLRRFGISLGFGNAHVHEVCAKAGIDCDTFLAVANFTTGRQWRHFHIDVPTLMVYLKNAHRYFLDFALPTIRRKLIEALPTSDPHAVTLLILRYFDDYVKDVREHMAFEDEYVFPYINNLLDGVNDGNFNISEFETSHIPLAPKLQELKEIIVSHYKISGNEDLLNSTLYDIITCERDLSGHCLVEDNLLVPAVENIVSQTPVQMEEETPGEEDDDKNDSAELSAREREVVQCIARGLSTKEIAEKLYLSTHTVNTHRRNICAKLDIHSAAGLAIYAIIQGLVDITEIKKSVGK